MDNTELIKNILSVITALIPLLIVLISLTRNNFWQSSQIFDYPALRLYSMHREVATFKASDYIRYNLNIILILIIYYIFIFALIFIFSIPLAFLYINLLILIVIIAISILNTSIKILSKRQAKYYAFVPCSIRIVSLNYQYLFNRCHEALINLGYKVFELNEIEGKIEFLKSSPLLIGAVEVKVNIIKLESLTNMYEINLEFEENKTSLLERTKIANSFINKLISKPKNGDDKASSEAEVATSGEAS
jgi:hypothetical protein